MNAKDFLKQVKKIDTQISNKIYELKTLLDGGLKDLAGEVEAEIKTLQNQKRAIIGIIENLPEAEYDVLHKVYVQHKTLKEVAGDRNIGYSLITTIHGKALKMVENIISG